MLISGTWPQEQHLSTFRYACNLDKDLNHFSNRQDLIAYITLVQSHTQIFTS